VSKEEAAAMFAEADWDGGGSITCTEFARYIGMPGSGKRCKLQAVGEERVRLVASCFNRLADQQGSPNISLVV
jgi:hypothetical protein